MNVRKTGAVARRVLSQLSHDHRTLALIILVPSLLLTIFRFVFQSQRMMFNGFAPLLLGIFPLVLMFIVTSVAMLRERRTGTLERLMTMPLSKLDLIFGYMLAFSALALVQVTLVCIVMVGFLDVPLAADVPMVALTAIMAALLGTALGLLVSAFADSEFQAVQFMPAIVFPQLLVCGLFAAREHMAWPLQWLSNVLPLTYSVDAMKHLITSSSWSGDLRRDLLVVAGFTIGALLLGGLTIRRQEA
jgi:ABC-2 type transport system permease protein